MALTSSMAPLGTPLPDITLPNLEGVPVNLAQFADGRPLVIAFVCNHCPYVQHIETEFGRFAADHPEIAVVAVCSNDATTHPDDDIPGLTAQVARANWTFPYLVDTGQRAARALGAVCTPDFFCFDRNGLLAYRGAFDDARPGQPTPVTGSDLRSAVAYLAAGDAVPEPHRPSLGCGIKWTPGNEPN
jgi:peroxiredoxin